MVLYKAEQYALFWGAYDLSDKVRPSLLDDLLGHLSIQLELKSS